MSPRLQLRLGLMLGIVVLLIEAAVFALLGGYYLRRFGAEVNRRFEESIGKPARLFSQGALTTDAFGQRDTLESLVGSGLDDAAVVAVNGIVLVALDQNRVGHAWSEMPGVEPSWLARVAAGGFDERLVSGGNSFLVRVAPVATLGGEAPALFSYLRLRTTEAERELAGLRLRIIGGSLLAGAATTLGLLVAVRLLVTRRLRQAAVAVAQVTAGNYSARLGEPPWHDEIGFLQAGLDTMTGRLRQTFEHLHRTARELDTSEQARRQEEENFRSLIDALPVAVYLVDPGSGRFIHANAAALSQFGCPAAQLVGTPLADRFVRPADHAALWARLFSRERSPAVELPLRDGQGRELWVQHSALQLESQGHRLVVGVLVNLTERRRIEEALRASETRLRSILELSPHVAVQWYDRAGRVRFWNAASTGLFGFTAAEAEGRPIEDLLLTPEAGAAFRQVCGEIVRTGTVAAPGEFVGRTKDGGTRVCLSSIFQIPGDGGEPGLPAWTWTSRNASGSPRNSGRRRSWKPSAGWRRGWRTTSTTC